MKHYGDITKINGSLVEPVNVVIGGSPCQDLSVAGKQAGLAGERSELFMEQLRIIKEMRRADLERGRTGKDTRPRYMVWENVPGAFSSNKGADFSIVLQETAKVACEQAPAVPIPKNGWPPAGCLTDVGGQWSIAWRVFDAQFWGVPQRRKRIALVADFGGLTAPEILFERQGVLRHIKPCGTQGQGAAGNTENGTNPTGGTGAYCIQGNCIDRADTAGCNGKGWTEGVSYTLNTIDRPAVLPFVPSPPQGDVVVFEPGSCSRVGGHIWQDGKAPALRAQSGDNQPAIALENHPSDGRVKIAEDGIVQTLKARMGTGGGMFPSLCVRSPVLEHSNAGATDVYPAGNKLQGATGCNNGGTKAMIMFENYQFANWRPGCGTLKASGGDYGGGSENLIVYQYWNGEQVTDTLTARNAGGGNGCQTNKILIV